VYSHLYYEKKLEQIINHDYMEYLAELPEGTESEKIVSFCNHCLHQLYDEETDEVKAEVEAFRQNSSLLKEEQEVEDMMNEGMSEEAICVALCKRWVAS
jgi:hypothetical protein